MDEEEESKDAVQVEQSPRWRVDQFKEHGRESSRLRESSHVSERKKVSWWKRLLCCAK